MSNVLELDPYLKLNHKDGGHIVIRKSIYEKQAKLKVSTFKGYETPVDASPAEVEDYEAHRKFLDMGTRLIELMEEWDADRPSPQKRYRYSAQDILNVLSTVLGQKPLPITPKSEQK